MRLDAALRRAVRTLEQNDVGSSRMNAETLLMFVLGCDRAYLYAHAERKLTGDEENRYNATITERSTGKPTQYITGHQEFWGLDFIVSPAVLIPRPETEHVIETALELAGLHSTGQRFETIADIGTGSGCIAVALAREFDSAQITAVDISPTALEIARANAARHQVEKRVTFLESDLLAALPKEHFDLVVSNPPYVGENEADKVQKQVRDFEPRVAVFSGVEGMDIYRRLIPQARAALRPGGWLVMEMGFSSEQVVRGLLAGWDNLRVTHDLQGIPRVISAQKPAAQRPA